MTGRLPGPTSHEAQARPPGPGTPERLRPGSAALGPPLCPGPGAPGEGRRGPAGTGARPGNAHHRFSLSQGRPPLPERWRRGSGCSEALGFKQRKKPLPCPAMTSPPRRHHPRLCLPYPHRGNIPPRHNVQLTWGPRGAAGGAAAPAGPAPPAPPACHLFNTPH